MIKIIIFLLGWLAGDVTTILFLIHWANKKEETK